VSLLEVMGRNMRRMWRIVKRRPGGAVFTQAAALGINETHCATAAVLRESTLR